MGIDTVLAIVQALIAFVTLIIGFATVWFIYVLSQEQRSTRNRLKDLSGNLKFNTEKLSFEIIIKNKGYATQRFSFIRTDKEVPLWGGTTIIKPKTLEVIDMDIYSGALQKLRKANYLFISTGEEKKEDGDKKKIISKKEFKRH